MDFPYKIIAENKDFWPRICQLFSFYRGDHRIAYKINCKCGILPASKRSKIQLTVNTLIKARASRELVLEDPDQHLFLRLLRNFRTS